MAPAPSDGYAHPRAANRAPLHANRAPPQAIDRAKQQIELLLKRIDRAEQQTELLDYCGWAGDDEQRGMASERARTSSQVAGGRARTGASGGRRARTGASGGRRTAAGPGPTRRVDGCVGRTASRRGPTSGVRRAGANERPGGDERWRAGGRGRAAGVRRGGTRRKSGGAGFFRSPLDVHSICFRTSTTRGYELT